MLKPIHCVLGLAVVVAMSGDSWGRSHLKAQPQHKSGIFGAQRSANQPTPPANLLTPEQIEKSIANGVNTAAQQYETRHPSPPPDNSGWWFNFLLVTFTGGLVFVGASQAFLTFWTLKTTQTAADAALRQANASIALESPILVVKEIKLVGYPDTTNPQSNEDPAAGQQIPAVCRALVGIMSIGRTYARITQFCLQWTITPTLPTQPQYLPAFIESVGDALFMPAHNFVNFFGLGHPANPIILTESDRQRLATGETFWVYGFIIYESFADEVFELGFIARWVPGKGLDAEANQDYAYRRKRNPEVASS